MMRGHIAQSVMCLTAEPAVASIIPHCSNTFMEMDHEIISKVILFPSTDAGRIVVSYKQNFVHEALVDCPENKSG